MSLNDVDIVKGTGGLGRQEPNEDGHAGIIMSGVAVSGGAQLNTLYTLNAPEDAEDIGLDAAYDTTNKTLVYYHIKEFFRMSPNATLYVWLVSQATTLTNMADKAVANMAKAMLLAAQGDIKLLGITRNPASGYTPSTSDGFDDDVVAALPKAQALAAEELTEHRPVDILLEGRGLNGAYASVLDLHDQDSEDVSITALQDLDIGDDDALYNEHAAVGTVLGVMSAAKVSESIAYVEKFNIQNKATAAFVNPGLSDGTALGDLSASDLSTLNGKGLIIPRLFYGYPGIYLNDSFTCTALSSDFAYIENNRTVKKAIRKTYLVMVPKINSPVKVDKSTGYIAAETIKAWESDIFASLNQMNKDEEISGEPDIFIDPKQNILSTSEVAVKIEVVPFGTARKISVTIKLTNPQVAS